jgi:hypothetical protein
MAVPSLFDRDDNSAALVEVQDERRDTGLPVGLEQEYENSSRASRLLSFADTRLLFDSPNGTEFGFRGPRPARRAA